MFADATEARVANTVAVLEEAGRRYWAPRRYETYYREAITAKDYSQAVPVVVTTLERLHSTARTRRCGGAWGARTNRP
ncbi:hypothetical protein ACLQ2E_16735 [Streptomyces lavendulocolor]